MTAEHYPIPQSTELPEAAAEPQSEFRNVDPVHCLRTAMEAVGYAKPDEQPLADALADARLNPHCPRSYNGCGTFYKIIEQSVLLNTGEDHRRQPGCRL